MCSVGLDSAERLPTSVCGSPGCIVQSDYFSSVTCLSVGDDSLDTALPVSPSRYPAPPVPALPDPATTSQLPPVPLRVVNALPTIDLFLSYTMSPAHSYYAPATSPITTDVPDTSEYLSPGNPAAMAVDGDLLLDCSLDLPVLPLPLLPLPASSVPSPESVVAHSPVDQFPSSTAGSPDLSREGPFDAGQSVSVTGDALMWIRPMDCSCITRVSWSTSGRPNQRVC